MRSESYGAWLVRLSMFILKQATRRLMSSKYQQLQCIKGSKNNVADFAETSEFEG